MMRRSRKVIMLLLLTYSVQALASVGQLCPAMTVSSAGSHMAGEVVVSADMTAHAGHQMSAEAATEGAPGSCCDGGLCSMSQCQSAPALPQTLPLPGHSCPVAFTATTDLSSPVHPSYSLYRPPISR